MSIRILVADDDPLMQDYLIKPLEGGVLREKVEKFCPSTISVFDTMLRCALTRGGNDQQPQHLAAYETGLKKRVRPCRAEPRCVGSVGPPGGQHV